MPRKKIDININDKKMSMIDRKVQDDLIESVLFHDNQEIIRPVRFVMPTWWAKTLGSIVLLLLVVSVYYFINRQSTNSKTVESWYAVKLVDGEMFYGKIGDIKSDPMVMNNVYYNYDQLKAKEENKPIVEPSSNIRLVKRGKETHGPDGALNVVRSQVLFLEAMKSDSKILKAIQDYEKR